VEAERLINACEPDFRALVRAGLETGCRYGDLTRLEVCDFNPDTSTLAIRQSKTGKPRHVVLTEEGAAFFRRHCAGRSGHELMFCHDDGGAWQNRSRRGRWLRRARASRLSPRPRSPATALVCRYAAPDRRMAGAADGGGISLGYGAELFGARQ
jgi:integrase